MSASLDVMQIIVENLVLWVLIIVGDAFVFTVFYRRMTGKWWWTKCQTKEWELKLTADDWSFGGSGTPLDTFRHIMEAMNGTARDAEVQRIVSVIQAAMVSRPPPPPQ